MKPVEWVILILVITVSTFVMMTIVNTTVLNNQLSAEKADMVKNIVLAMINIINIGVGALLNQSAQDRKS